MTRLVLAVGVVAAVLAWAGIEAIAVNSQLTAKDIQRATELARWPHTDAERAQFHKRYTIVVNGKTVEYFAIETIEITTPFRRMELIAEEHARINDLFARGGVRDAEEAIRPWRDRLSVVARLRFDLTKLIPDVPELEMALEGPNPVFPTSTNNSRIDIAIDNGDRTQLVGGLVEAVFDIRAVSETTKEPVVVRWNGKEIARVAVDFAAIE